jgi:hypothetical protein
MPPTEDIGPINPSVVARRLGRYDEGLKTSHAALANHIALATANESVARAIQNQVGDDVVILFNGRAYVPYVSREGSRSGYDVMPCYDLDAAIIGIKLDEPEANRDGL